MRRCCAFLTAAVLTLLAAPSRAAVLHVKPDAPGPVHDGTSWATAFLSLQSALDAAQPDDEVRAASGTYRENLAFPRERVTLRGGYAGTETGPDAPPAGTESTILGTEPETPVVYFPPDASGCGIRTFTVLREVKGPEAGIRCETTGVLIEGVTVRGIGQPGGWGGGIAFLAQSEGTVRGCLIEGNTSREGGGIHLMMAEATIERCVIRENVSEDSGPVQPDFPIFGRGGGIWANRSRVQVRWNTITENRAWGGGGIYMIAGYATVANNTISGNIAQTPAPPRPSLRIWSYGGGIQAGGIEGELRNNIIAGNSALAAPDDPDSPGASGGGAALGGSAMDVVNNTFADNVAHTESGGGSMAGVSGNPVGVFTNNIISGNRSDTGPPSLSSGGDSRNLWWANSPEDPEERVPYVLVGDTRFTDGYHLLQDSMAIDRGVPDQVGEGDVDIDGEARIRGRRVDLGADEAPPVPGVRTVHVSTDGNDMHDGASWMTAKRTIHAALDVVSWDGEVWVAKGVYRGGLRIESRVGLYGGFAGRETSRDARDARENVTLIEMGGPVVGIPSGSHDVTLDGFTIRNGYAMSGAGIQSGGRNIMLSHNVVENNVAEGFDYWSYISGGGIRLRNGPVSVTNSIIRNNKVLVTIFCAPVAFAPAVWLPAPRFGPDAAYGNPYEEYPILTGGGIEARGAEVLIANNLFTGNSVGSGSGAALTAWESSGLIANNTFADNMLPGLDPRYMAYAAEAVSIRDCGSDLVFANNILAFNPAGLRMRISNVVPRDNAFFANLRWHVWGGPDEDTLDGSLAANPVFVDRAAGDYRLGVGSPLIDRGDGSIVQTGWTDLAGNPRVLGAGVDIGAYEFVPSAGLTLGHAAWALRVAAGLGAADAPALSALDAAGPAGRIDVRDAVEIARRVATD